MKAKRKYNLFRWQNRAFKHNNGEPDAEVKCEICGDNRVVTVDHIIPQTFLKSLDTDIEWGLDMEENFRFLCKYHNQLKHSTIDAKDPRTYSIMRKVLDEAEKFHLQSRSS